jgi:TrmH family RNA methyltransferase
MQRIASRNNPRLKEAARLVASSRDRRKAGKCVLEGEHLVESYAERYGAPETLVVCEASVARDGVAALVRRFEDRALIVGESLFAELAVAPAGIGVLAVVATPRVALSPGGRLCLLLDDVQDPGNVGSMLRSAAAAGAADAYLSRRCAFAWSPKVLRAGMGAHFALGVHEDVDLVAWSCAYRARGGRVVALVRNGGRDLFDVDLAPPIALAIGNEGAGVSDALVAAASARATITMPGCIESLNAGAAAAIALFECVRRARGTA